MSHLYLFIDSNWPAQHKEARWYLLDTRGQVQRQGQSEPRYWPGVRLAEPALAEPALAEHQPMPTTIILTGPQTACQRLQLPQGKAARRPDILAAAIEDKLLQEPADCLLLPSKADSDGLSSVAVVARERLRQIHGSLCELGLAPVAAWPLGFALPRQNGERLGRFESGYLTLPFGENGFVACDLAVDGVLPAIFSEALPAALRISLPAGLSLPATPGLAWLAVPESVDQLPVNCPAGPGFLTGEFSPRQTRWASWPDYLPVIKWAGGAALLLMLLAAGEWYWLAQQSRALRQNIESVFHETFSQAAMVDPVLQMQRQVDDRRRQVGELAASDLLVMLDRLTEGGGINCLSFDFVPGRLDAEILLPAGGLNSLRGASLPGYKLQILQEDGQPDGQTRIKLRLSVGA